VLILRDVQNERDKRNIRINMVGIKSIEYPIVVLDREFGTQHTVGNFDLFVDLPTDFRGTHMSRFVVVLERITRKSRRETWKSILNALEIP
jgi:GTP cyclohydrolase I